MRFPNRLTRRAPLLAVLLLACSDDGLSPWPPGVRRELTAQDYAVYSAWLTAYQPRGGGIVLVDDRTTGGGYPGLSLVSRWVGTHGTVTEPPVQTCATNEVCPVPPVPTPPDVGPEPSDEASEDFRLQQELSLPLERRLTGAVYDLVRDPIPEDLLAGARLVLAFSRVGFDSRVGRARFRVVQAVRGDWGWMPPIGFDAWSEKRGPHWALTEVREVWRSDGVAVPPPVPDSGSVVIIGQPLVTMIPWCRAHRLPHVWFCTRAGLGPGP